MRLGTVARKQYYAMLDTYIKDHIDETEVVNPRKLAEMCAIISPEIPVAHVRTVCTNFIYLLFYLMREKKLKIKLPKQLSGVRTKKT